MLYLLTIFFLVLTRVLWLGAGVSAICVLLSWLGILGSISFWWPIGLGVGAFVSIFCSAMCVTAGTYPPRGF